MRKAVPAQPSVVIASPGVPRPFRAVANQRCPISRPRLGTGKGATTTTFPVFTPFAHPAPSRCHHCHGPLTCPTHTTDRLVPPPSSARWRIPWATPDWPTRPHHDRMGHTIERCTGIRSRRSPRHPRHPRHAPCAPSRPLVSNQAKATREPDRPDNKAFIAMYGVQR